MRIGEAARRAGTSPRMVRYYEDRGLMRPSRSPSGHRRYEESDVVRLRALRTLTSAGIPADVIPSVLPGAGDEPSAAVQRDAVVHVLAEALRLLQRGSAPQVPSRAGNPAPSAAGAGQAPPEHAISLMFDVFVVSSRMGAVLDTALRPVGVTATEYALLSLLDIAGPMTPTRVARTVGVAPSTLAGQVKALVRTGLVGRRRNPADRRSALLELTPQGRERYAAAMQLAATASRTLHRQLAGEGVRAEDVRARLRALSAALQSTLETTSES